MGRVRGPVCSLAGWGWAGSGPGKLPAEELEDQVGARGTGVGGRSWGFPDHGTGAGLWIQVVGEGRGTWPAALGWGYTGRCLGLGVVTLYQDIN